MTGGLRRSERRLITLIQGQGVLVGDAALIRLVVGAILAGIVLFKVRVAVQLVQPDEQHLDRLGEVPTHRAQGGDHPLAVIVRRQDGRRNCGIRGNSSRHGSLRAWG